MESLLHNLVKAFGWSILHSIWQSGIIYAVLLAVLLSAPKLKANIRHNLAYGAVCSMFGWFMITFFNQVNFTKPVLSNITQENFSQFGLYINSLPETFAQKAEVYFPQVVLAYIIGIFLQLFVIVKGYIFLRKLKTKSLSEVPSDWALKFNSIVHSLELQRNINFNLSALVNVPVVVGYLKPIVLFPISLVTQLDNDQVEAILIHELSHIRRNDYLLNLIKTTIETVLFFNPFVWLAGKFIQIEREHACDDLVLKLSGKPLTYAHALLKLELIKDNSTPAYALGVTGKTQHLYQRIKRITNMKTNYLNTKQQMAALTLAVAGLLSVAWVNPEVKQKAKDVTQQIADSKIFTFIGNEQVGKIEAATDTTKKKKKIKIVITDDNGVTKEYNSIAELPDSLKKNFRIFSTGGKLNAISIFGDSMNHFKFGMDSAFNHRFKTINGLHSLELFNSPAQLEKFKKMQEDWVKKFNSPEEQTKWKKMSEDMAKNMPSAAQMEKFKKMSEDWVKKFNSPEEQAKWKKMSVEMTRRASGLELKNDQLTLLKNLPGVYLNGDSINKKFKSLNFSSKDGLNKIIIDGKEINAEDFKSAYKFGTVDTLLARLPGFQYKFETKAFSKEDRTLQQSDEYKKLKENFDKEVEALKKKMKDKKNDK